MHIKTCWPYMHSFQLFLLLFSAKVRIFYYGNPDYFMFFNSFYIFL